MLRNCRARQASARGRSRRARGIHRAARERAAAATGAPAIPLATRPALERWPSCGAEVERDGLAWGARPELTQPSTYECRSSASLSREAKSDSVIPLHVGK